MKNTELILVHEPGLGDHLICNGLVNYLSKRVDKLLLATYANHAHQNLSTVTHLYSNNPQIEIIPVPIFLHHWLPCRSWQDYFGSWNTPILQIHKPPESNPYWYQYFYQQVGLPWQAFQAWADIPDPTARSWEILQEIIHQHGPHYRIIHNQSSHGVYEFQSISNINLPTVCITPGISNNLLDWQLVISHAQEIHVCQSSVFWLCNLLDVQTSNLYYHNSRPTNHHVFPQHFPKWTFVNGYL